MKKGLMKGLIALIIILFTNIAIFLLLEEFDTTFWICYTFSMLAALITSFIEIFYGKKEALIFRYPVSMVTFLYLIIQLVVSVIAFKFFREHVLMDFLVQLYIFASYLILLLSVFIHNTTTKEQQKARGTDIVNFKIILDRMNSVISKTEYSDAKRKELQHAYDSLASGQVRSNEAAQTVELQIMNLIDLLEEAVTQKQQDNVSDLCRKLEKAAEERKRILLSSKLF